MRASTWRYGTTSTPARFGSAATLVRKVSQMVLYDECEASECTTTDHLRQMALNWRKSGRHIYQRRSSASRLPQNCSRLRQTESPLFVVEDPATYLTYFVGQCEPKGRPKESHRTGSAESDSLHARHVSLFKRAHCREPILKKPLE